LLVHGDAGTPVTGLDAFPRSDWPPVAIPFYSYHVMVGLGVYFLLLCAVGWIYYLRRKLSTSRWLLWVFVFSVIGPFVSNQAGWVAAEVGRQPWAVYNLLRTSDAGSKAVQGDQVLVSIVIFSVIYLFLMLVWLTVLNRKIKTGPEDELGEVEGTPRRVSWIDSAAALAESGGPSLTDSRPQTTDGNEG
jgi:cytochrome d ubiquinol oxidase subunit I